MHSRIGFCGRQAVLGVVKAALDVILVGTNVDGAVVLRAGAAGYRGIGEAVKFGNSVRATLIFSEALS